MDKEELLNHLKEKLESLVVKKDASEKIKRAVPDDVKRAFKSILEPCKHEYERLNPRFVLCKHCKEKKYKPVKGIRLLSDDRRKY